MKRHFISFFLILSLLMAACFPASADVITALAIEVNPEHLEKTASYARILGYNEESNTLTVELIAPEVFDGERKCSTGKMCSPCKWATASIPADGK